MGNEPVRYWDALGALPVDTFSDGRLDSINSNIHSLLIDNQLGLNTFNEDAIEHLEELLEEIQNKIIDRNNKCEVPDDVGNLLYTFVSFPRRTLSPLIPFYAEGVVGFVGDAVLERLLESPSAANTIAIASLGANLNSTITTVRFSIRGTFKKCLCVEGDISWSDPVEYLKDLDGGVQGVYSMEDPVEISIDIELGFDAAVEYANSYDNYNK